MVLTEFIPYLKQHCNLSAMEQAATAALREGQNISPEQTAYYNVVVAYAAAYVLTALFMQTSQEDCSLYITSTSL